MGRGNSRPGEATYYVDYDKFTCFFCDEEGNDTEERDYDCERDYMGDYIYNIQNDENIIQHFTRVEEKEWYDSESRIIAYNKYYIIVVFDNDWSLGFSLIKKDFWDEHTIYDYDTEEESRNAEAAFEKEQAIFTPVYKNLLIKTMLDYSNEIYMPTGPWTSSKITRESIEGELNDK